MKLSLFCVGLQTFGGCRHSSLFTPPLSLISVISPSFKNPNMARKRATLFLESEYEQMPSPLSFFAL